MKDLLRLFTPPEWFDWNLWGRLAYLVVFVGLMIPVYWAANIFADWFSTWATPLVMSLFAAIGLSD